jgi:hypothetical protein
MVPIGSGMSSFVTASAARSANYGIIVSKFDRGTSYSNSKYIYRVKFSDSTVVEVSTLSWANQVLSTPHAGGFCYADGNFWVKDATGSNTTDFYQYFAETGTTVTLPGSPTQYRIVFGHPGYYIVGTTSTTIVKPDGSASWDVGVHPENLLVVDAATPKFIVRGGSPLTLYYFEGTTLKTSHLAGGPPWNNTSFCTLRSDGVTDYNALVATEIMLLRSYGKEVT